MPGFLSFFRSQSRAGKKGMYQESAIKERCARRRGVCTFKGGRRVTFKVYHVLALRANTPRVRITLRRPGIV